MEQKTSVKIESRQKRLYLLIIGSVVLVLGCVIFISMDKKESQETTELKNQFDVPSNDIKPENIRITHIEKVNDVLSERLQSLEKTFLNLREEKSIMEIEKEKLVQENEAHRQRAEELEAELINQSNKQISIPQSSGESQFEATAPAIKMWEASEKLNDRHIAFEIPAGSVVKAVLLSGADCSVGVHKPTGPNMVLLRPLDNGKLPRNVKVPLKGSVIIGNAVGDIASERVYIRAERMTLVERDGSFVETEVSAYVSGEDGREGLRGVVVDRSGQIITRAAFAAFLQGVGQTLEATLNNQVIEKLAETNTNKTLLNIDLYRTSAIQGGSTALSRLSDYYIKRAEQLQPTIQIAAGRIVDVIFTKTVKVGEKDLKKKLEKERELKLRELKNG